VENAAPAPPAGLPDGLFPRGDALAGSIPWPGRKAPALHTDDEHRMTDRCLPDRCLPPPAVRRASRVLAAAVCCCSLAVLPHAARAADSAPAVPVSVARIEMPASPAPVERIEAPAAPAPVARTETPVPPAPAARTETPAAPAFAARVETPAAPAAAARVEAPAASASAPHAETPAETLRAEALRHEHGEGVPRDPARAAELYCSAAQLGDAVSQYNLGWMYAHGRGIERNDAWAAYFFKAAADQGIEQAARMLASVGGPTSQVPDCMRPPAPPADAVPDKDGPSPLRPQSRIVPPKLIAGMVQSLAPAYGVEPSLVLAIMKAESNFDAQALSPKNAMGLMQLIPQTAERFRVKDAYDPKQNIRGGMAYLRWLLAYFEGDVALVAAAYNAGEGAVERHRGVPPYAETRSYVARVLGAVGKLVHPFDAAAARPSSQLRFMQDPVARAAAMLPAAVRPAAAPSVTALATTTAGDARRVRFTIERQVR
jgi:hypothetical protein